MNALYDFTHMLIFKNIATACRFHVLCETYNVFWVSASIKDVQMLSKDLYSVFQQAPNPT